MQHCKEIHLVAIIPLTQQFSLLIVTT